MSVKTVIKARTGYSTDVHVDPDNGGQSLALEVFKSGLDTLLAEAPEGFVVDWVTLSVNTEHDHERRFIDPEERIVSTYFNLEVTAVPA